MRATEEQAGSWRPPALQALPTGAVPWHEHRSAYLALVLEGGYEEAGDQGRCRPTAGEAVLHLPFEGHGNLVERGARVMNLTLTLAGSMRLAAAGEAEAVACLEVLLERRGVRIGGGFSLAKRAPPVEEADQLAAELLLDGAGALDEIAGRLGVPGRTLRRRFGRVYGVSPAAFRGRARARRAFGDLVLSGKSLSSIAYDHGFADHAHMCRAVVALTGLPPGAWRRRLAVSFKTSAPDLG